MHIIKRNENCIYCFSQCRIALGQGQQRIRSYGHRCTHTLGLGSGYCSWNDLSHQELIILLVNSLKLNLNFYDLMG